MGGEREMGRDIVGRNCQDGDGQWAVSGDTGGLGAEEGIYHWSGYVYGSWTSCYNCTGF